MPRIGQIGRAAAAYPKVAVANVLLSGSNNRMSKASGSHDVGGFAAGPIDRSEQDTAYWEWQVDAMIRLALSKGLITDFAELRDGIERLEPEDYERLTYYERWGKSLAYTLLASGAVTQKALDAKIDEIRERQTVDGLR